MLNMKKYICCAVLVWMSIPAELTSAATLTVDRGGDLQSVIDFAADGDTLVLGPREFRAAGTRYDDPLCGNCLDPEDGARASYGFIIKNKALVLIGLSRTKTKLTTNAGYGMYFENSRGSVLSNLTITGGKRDDDGDATDAGVVVRRSRVHLNGIDIRGNTDRSSDSTVAVGIGGVFGREGAEICVTDCNILNNGWDGIALYRGAVATVTDCTIKDGRGAGIGVTWDATCTAYRNEVSGFWKGIGSFGTSVVVARNNLVHDNLGWGIIATGQSMLEATNNIVHHNGNCGIATWSTEARGRFINNIIVSNGWRDEWVCPCVGVKNYGDWAKWIFRNNIVWNNQAGEYEDIWDQSGINGNLSLDPMFIEDGSYRLQPGSPALHAGDTTIYNIDGSVSHIGAFGGPQALDSQAQR